LLPDCAALGKINKLRIPEVCQYEEQPGIFNKIFHGPAM
jgi:hypothetical protein